MYIPADLLIRYLYITYLTSLAVALSELSMETIKWILKTRHARVIFPVVDESRENVIILVDLMHVNKSVLLFCL